MTSSDKKLAFLFSYIALDLVGFGEHHVLSGHLDKRDLVVPNKSGDKWRRAVASFKLFDVFKSNEIGCDPFNPFQSVCNLHQGVCIACHEEHFAAFNLTSVDLEHRSEYFHTSYWNTVENRFNFSYFRTSRCKIFNSLRSRSFQNTISTLIQ